MVQLKDLAGVIRSKNAGPFTFTIDILFEKSTCAEEFFKKITEQEIAEIFKVPEEKIEIIFYPPVNAVKINIPRETPSGHPGDRDVYGAQQHAPLLELDIDIDC